MRAKETLIATKPTKSTQPEQCQNPFHPVRGFRGFRGLNEPGFPLRISYTPADVEHPTPGRAGRRNPARPLGVQPINEKTGRLTTPGLPSPTDYRP